MPRLVELEIDQATGDFTLDLTGFKGKGCKDVAKAFESLGKVTKDVTKPEAYQVTTTGKQVTK